MDKNLQAQMRYAMYHNEWQQEFELQRKLDAMEQRITENVMKNVNIRIEDEAIRRLEDMINRLGN